MTITASGTASGTRSSLGLDEGSKGVRSGNLIFDGVRIEMHAMPCHALLRAVRRQHESIQHYTLNFVTAACSCLRYQSIVQRLIIFSASIYILEIWHHV